MTIYASKTPRDLNHDPKCRNCGCTAHPPGDGINGGCRAQWVEPDGWTMTCGCREGQASAVPHVQHNEPNPILIAFREYVEGADLSSLIWAANHWLWVFCHRDADTGANRIYDEVILAGDPDRDPPRSIADAWEDHARRVLERLASLARLAGN